MNNPVRTAEGRCVAKARASRAEVTLSPQGGGRGKVRPGRPGCRKAPEARGSPDQTMPKGSVRDAFLYLFSEAESGPQGPRFWCRSTMRPRPVRAGRARAIRSEDSVRPARSNTRPAVSTETVSDLRESPRTGNGLWIGSMVANRGRWNVEGLVGGSGSGRSAVRRSSEESSDPLPTEDRAASTRGSTSRSCELSVVW
jgi:hypothetical protein